MARKILQTTQRIKGRIKPSDRSLYPFFQKGVEDLHEGRVVDIFGKQIALGEADFSLPDRLLDLSRKP